MKNSLKMCLLSLLVLSPLSCFRGKGELKQGARTTASSQVLISSRDENGAIIGSIKGNSQDTQVLKAADGSQVEGTEVSFPPGSLAVDTEITLRIGGNIANDKVVTQLDLGTTVSSASTPVEITSSAPIDALQPFTIALSIPGSAGLALADSYTNLSIIYSVNKAGQGNAPYIGVIPRQNLSIFGNKVSFQINYFGTFQAVITKEPVTVVKELNATPISVVANGVKTFFAKGFLPVAGKSRGWAQPLSPSSVNVGESNLRTNIQVGK